MYVAWSSVTTDYIPTDADIVFYYEFGEFAQGEAVKKRCPNARLYGIATKDGERAAMYDYESGAMTYDGLVSAVEADLADGRDDPIIYASFDIWSLLEKDLHNSGIERDKYRKIDAHWTNVAHVSTGSDGTQWTEVALGKSLNEYLLKSDFFTAHTTPSVVQELAYVAFQPSDGKWFVKGVPHDTFRLP